MRIRFRKVFKYCLFPSVGLSSSSHTPPILAQIMPPSPIFQLCDMNRSEDWSGSCLETPCLELEVELVVFYYYIYMLLSVSAHRNEKSFTQERISINGSLGVRAFYPRLMVVTIVLRFFAMAVHECCKLAEFYIIRYRNGRAGTPWLS